MLTRSHIDPTLFIIFEQIDARNYDFDFLNRVRKTKYVDGTGTDWLYSHLPRRRREVLLHEHYHFWQGLRLPFLHRYAVATFSHMLSGVYEFARISEDWTRWTDNFAAHAPDFDRLDVDFFVTEDGLGHFAFGREFDPHKSAILKYSAKDMMECAASIFDFQVSCNEPSQITDLQRFRRWRKRRPAYLRPFDFVATVLGSEPFTLRILLPLINAAFHTSLPERAFVELLVRIWGQFVHANKSFSEFTKQPEPCRWPEYFMELLTELDYDYPVGSDPDTINLLEREFYYLDPKVWLGMKVSENMTHPILGPKSIEWSEKEAQIPGLDALLDLPGYVTSKALGDYALATRPEIRVLRIVLADREEKVLCIGEGRLADVFSEEFYDSYSESDFRGLAVDILALYGAFRRVTGAQLTNVSRTCSHINCPYFRANYCNSYPLIPDSFPDCGFPDRMARWVTHFRRK